METKSTNKVPLVSVIIPAFNVGKYIDQCLTSVVKQTYSNLQIIIVDDGSTDKTTSICDTWAKSDNRILSLHQKNQGPSAARNFGISRSEGDYILFLDADDTLDPKTIASLTKLAMLSADELVAFDVQPFDIKNGEKLSRSKKICPYPFPTCKESTGAECLEFIHSGHLPNFIPLFLYKNTLFSEKEFTFPEGLKVLEDVAFVNQHFDKVNRVGYLGKRFYHYSCNRTNSLTSTKDAQNISNSFSLIKGLSKNCNPNDSDYINYLINLLFYLYSLFFNSGTQDKELGKQIREEILKLASNHLWETLSSRNLVKALLTKLHLFGILLRIRKHVDHH